MKIKVVTNTQPQDLWPVYEVLYDGIPPHVRTSPDEIGDVISLIRNVETGRVWYIKNQDIYNWDKYRIVPD